MKQIVALLALVFAVAATPAEVAEVASQQGYFVEDGTSATDEGIGRAVSDARSAGGLLYIVVLADDPAGGAVTFAEVVLNDLPNGEGTVLTISPAEVGWAKHNSYWTVEELDAATEASLDGSSDDEVAQLFVASLLEEDTGGSGNGRYILFGIIVLIGGGIAFLVWRSSKSRKVREGEVLADLKAKAQAQIDAVANDILDDEDEIAEAENPDASQHFDDATAIYSDAADRLGAAATGAEVIEISTKLDQAIWHLDCSEAILDGQPLPPRPEPPSPEPASPQPAPSAVPPTSASPPPLQPYQRRSARRSSFGTDDMLKTVLAMQAMRSIGGSRGGGSGRGTSSSRSMGSTSSSRSPGRARGGGRRRR